MNLIRNRRKSETSASLRTSDLRHRLGKRKIHQPEIDFDFEPDEIDEYDPVEMDRRLRDRSEAGNDVIDRKKSRPNIKVKVKNERATRVRDEEKEREAEQRPRRKSESKREENKPEKREKPKPEVAERKKKSKQEEDDEMLEKMRRRALESMSRQRKKEESNKSKFCFNLNLV